MTTVSLSDPSQISTLKDRFSPMPVSTKSTPALAPLRLIQVSQQYDNLAQPEKPLQILDRVDLSISAGTNHRLERSQRMWKEYTLTSHRR